MSEKKTFPKVVTPVGKASRVYISKPDSQGEYADNKFKVTILFEKGTDLGKIKTACQKAAEVEWGDVPDNLEMPLRDGDEYYDDAETDKQREAREPYRGHVFITAKSKFAPGVIDRNKDDLELTENFWIGGGDLIRISAVAFPYKRQRVKGVTLQLRNVQLIEKRGSNGNAADDFDDDFEDDDYESDNAGPSGSGDF